MLRTVGGSGRVLVLGFEAWSSTGSAPRFRGFRGARFERKLWFRV